MIKFNEVPKNVRVPGVYIEIDPSLASAADQQQILLIVPGVATVPPAESVNDIAYPVKNAQDVSEIFGENSDAHKMAIALFNQSQVLPISVIGVEPSQDIATALAALGDTQYHYIISYFNESSNIGLLSTFLEDRHTAMQQIPGLGFVGFQGTAAEVNAFTSTFNSPFISILGVNGLDVSVAEAAAAYYGQCAYSLSVDPARPLQTLQLQGVKTNADTEWTSTERDLMLNSGASTYTTDITGDVFIERAITTYHENELGFADDTYLDIMTIATAMYFRHQQRQRILKLYPRHKLARDGVNFAAGQAVVTPKLFKAAMLGLYRDLEEQAIVQNFENYQQTFISEIDDENVTRINYQDQPTFINGLIIVAGKMQFRKN